MMGCVCVLLSGRLHAASPGVGIESEDSTELRLQFEVLQGDLKKRQRIAGYASQVTHEEALILDADRDPVDVVLRRTEALLDDLSREAAPPFTTMRKELAVLREEVLRTEVEDAEGRYAVYEKLCALRRRIAFSNPLLDFDEVLFMKRHRSGFNHMCDQYYGVNA
ncbi:MAG: hypothetical protein QGH41_13560, partial [Roseibacillus sp.]|nr:hypothetical protein [Roseibacillus sp.]